MLTAMRALNASKIMEIRALEEQQNNFVTLAFSIDRKKLPTAFESLLNAAASCQRDIDRIAGLSR